MRNHLFIGLGGQGGRTLGELRKVMAQRARDAQLLNSQDVHIAFLAIDSSDDVRNDKRTWTDFGTDLALDPNDWLILSRPGQGAIGGLALRPDIAPWLGARERVEGFLNQGQIQGANQRRRFGRLLFAYNATAIRAAVTDKVNTITAARRFQCAFHIFATLGGGTGSGGLIDLVALIRARYPNGDPAEFPIFVYVYATDADEKGANVGYFFQNQLTGLRDLNALMCGRLRPQLLGDDIAAGILAGAEPIAQLTITSPLNSANHQIPLDTQIRIVAEACFERILAWSSGQMTPEAQRSLTGEDILATFPAEPPGRAERSYRFSALGMRRWEVPDDKLTALVALDLLVSSLRQMLFNHWHDTHGFSHQLADGSSAHAASAVPGLLTEIEDARRPLPKPDTLIQRLRDALSQQAVGLVRATGQVPLTLRAIEQDLANYYRGRFETVGVDALIRQRETEQQAKVDDATNRLEAHLSRLWLARTNPLALARIPPVLDELDTRLKRETESGPTNDARNERCQRMIEARRLEWDKLTWLSARLTGKRRRLIETHAGDCGALHEGDLHARYGQLDRTFVRALLGRLTNVKRRFQSTQQALQRLLDAVQKERDLIDRELRNLPHDVAANKYEFDPAVLDAFLTWMRGHHGHQESAAFLMRDAICQTIGSTQPLSALDDTSMTKVDDQLRRVAKEQASLIHQDYEVSHRGRPILEDSVLDILQQRHSEKRQAFLAQLQDFLGQAAVCLHLRNDTQPMQLLGSGVGVPHMPKRLLLIGLPRHAFTQTLEQEFLAALPAGQDRMFQVFEHDDPGQIRLLTVDYWLAARFSTIVKVLGDKYQETTVAAQNPDTIYFCNMDPEGEQDLRPDLFLPSDAEMRLRYEAEIWLGQQPDIGVVMVDDNGVFLIHEDQHGRHAESLGQSLEGAVASPDYRKMFALHGRLGGVLAGFDRLQFNDLLNKQRKAMEQKHGLTSEAYRQWDHKLKLLRPLVD